MTHLYTGSSGNLRDRTTKHLFGDGNVSSFRRTLLAAERTFAAIPATGAELPAAPNDEFALDVWLGEDGAIAFKRCSDHLAEEARILDLAPSPLNITLRRCAPFAKRLMAIRSQYDDREVARHCAEFV